MILCFFGTTLWTWLNQTDEIYCLDFVIDRHQIFIHGSIYLETSIDLSVSVLH